MKAKYLRRQSRRRNNNFDGNLFKHEAVQETPFFSAPIQSNFFRPSTKFIQAKCEKCEEEDKKVGRKEQSGAPATSTKSVSSYIQSLNGSGNSLTGATKTFFQKRMGTDLSHVRIHNDSEAHKSAKEIHAKAYTIGNNIVFAPGRYRPDTYEGKMLLAHELTHVLQQKREPSSLLIQRIACESGLTAPPRVAQDPRDRNRRDSRADAIIGIASDTTLSMEQKGINILTQIICHYYPSDAGLVSRISYQSDIVGLDTTSVGRGATTTGHIKVGDQYINDTTNTHFARRVLQAGHELEHVRQYRSGLAGRNNQDQREFLAFADEALADEFQGTGRMTNSTRVALIDGAIGYYFCLDDTLRTQHAGKLRQLQQRRQTIMSGGRVSGRADAPDSCRRVR